MIIFLLSVTAILSLALSAFCSGAETGFLSVQRGRIIHMVREGGARAKIINAAISNLGRTTTALLVGNNLANVTFSSASAALVAAVLPSSPAWHFAWSVASAALLLCLGEFAPKLLFSARPLRRLLALAPLWRVFAKVFVPVGAAVQNVIVRFMPKREAKLRITPDTVLKILEDRKDGVKLSDFESVLIRRIMTLRSKGKSITPESLLSAL